MGIMSIGSSNTTRIKLTDGKGNHVGTISVTKPSTKKKKRLQYNFREISNRILQTKTSGTASRVLVSARSKVAMLARMVRNPDYDEKELEQALIHAKKMERIAKKRMKHLQQEEKAERTGSCSDDLDAYEEAKASAEAEAEAESEQQDEEMEALMQEYQASMQSMEESMEKSMEKSMEELTNEMMAEGLDELSDELGLSVQKNMSPEDLERLKKKHRADELKEITEADLKYLKALFDKLAKEKSEASSGVSLQISGMEMPVETAEAPVTVEGANLDVSV